VKVSFQISSFLIREDDSLFERIQHTGDYALSAATAVTTGAMATVADPLMVYLRILDGALPENDNILRTISLQDNYGNKPFSKHSKPAARKGSTLEELTSCGMRFTCFRAAATFISEMKLGN